MLIQALIIMGGLGLLFGIGLGIASKYLSIDVDPRVEHVLEALPGVNCGACGYAGCAGLAEAIVKGEAAISTCPVNPECVHSIAIIMNVEPPVQKHRRIARCLCNGDKSAAKDKFVYHGVQKCSADAMVGGGHKLCNYGCLGWGDCAEACPFDAIVMGENGLPVVIAEKCTACGKCVAACPRNLFLLVEEPFQVDNICSSHAQGKDVRNACSVGCIACGLCEKTCPVNAITIKDNCAIVDYEKCIVCGMCAKVCPTHSIRDMRPADYQRAVIDPEKCIGCSICAKVCPVNAASGELKQKFSIEREQCIGCKLCIDKCPTSAIRLE